MSTDIDIDALIQRMRKPGPVDDDPRDHETAWGMRHDPEADLDRMEDHYEASLDATH